ncbi:MAG: molybdopterin-dependent oxidoreductase, partial [Caldisericia bacterium]|nr:molybdopterin-dependent oxidoreductase [Caldisericia bacterium]
MKKRELFVLILFISLIFIFAINYFINRDKRPIVLEEKEILNYNGENLSSINSFRENSIKGPQFVDIKNYRLKIFGLVKNEKSYSYEEMLNKFQKYKKVTTLYCVEGWNVKILWEGFLVRD